MRAGTEHRASETPPVEVVPKSHRRRLRHGLSFHLRTNYEFLHCATPSAAGADDSLWDAHSGSILPLIVFLWKDCERTFLGFY